MDSRIWEIPTALGSYEKIEMVWNYQTYSTTWRVTADNKISYLKIGDISLLEAFRREQAGMNFLQNKKISVPTVMRFSKSEDLCWLQTHAIVGEPFVNLRETKPPEWIVQKFAVALLAFHQIEISDSLPDVWATFHRDWFGGKQLTDTVHTLLHQLKQQSLDPVILHGDFCLPNVIFCEKIEQVGYVDVGGICIGNREFDIAIALYSLEMNFGNSYEPLFLACYGHVINIEALRLWKELLAEL